MPGVSYVAFWGQVDTTNFIRKISDLCPLSHCLGGCFATFSRFH